MPLINRNINHRAQVSHPTERVKIEEPFVDQEESLISEENKEVIEGKWNDDQNLKFVIFVNYYQDIFSSRHKRKTSKIFKTFEEYLHDRTAAQCRSHYQKIIQKFKTVAKVKKHYETYYGRQVYRQEFQKFREKWEQTHPPINNKDPQIREFKEISIQTEPIQQGPQDNLCSNCSRMIQPESPLISQPNCFQVGDYNPFLYWSQMNNMGMNYYCVFPPRSEQTIDIS